MLHRLSIRQRMLVTFLAVVLTGGILQLVIAGRQLQLATLEFYQHHLETDATTFASTLSEPLEYYLEGENTGAIQRALAGFQQTIGADYWIVDSSYRVIGYSASSSLSAVDRVPETPELVEARQNQIGSDIRSDPTGASRLYVAVRVTYEQRIMGYLVVSKPLQPAYDDVYRRWLELASATLPVIGLVIVASLWISGSISRPIRKLRNSALQMARGVLDTRIEIQSQDEVGQLAQTFNFMAEQVEDLIKAQRSFVSNAAHELRTPLMTLKLRVEALQDDDLESAQRATYLREIQQEIDHMAELVSSLLVLARIDEGRHTRDGKVTDTAASLQDIARHWRIEAEQAGLVFKTDITPGLPELPVNADDLRLMLDNLLGNAIKYTPAGEVCLKASLQGNRVILQITDTGGGFVPEQGANLFERFYRADDVRTQFAGNGLGLSIVKSLLEQYGGSIEAHSTGIGQGAVFTMMLPLSVPRK